MTRTGASPQRSTAVVGAIMRRYAPAGAETLEVHAEDPGYAPAGDEGLDEYVEDTDESDEDAPESEYEAQDFLTAREDIWGGEVTLEMPPNLAVGGPPHLGLSAIMARDIAEQALVISDDSQDERTIEEIERSGDPHDSPEMPQLTRQGPDGMRRRHEREAPAASASSSTTDLATSVREAMEAADEGDRAAARERHALVSDRLEALQARVISLEVQGDEVVRLQDDVIEARRQRH